MGNTSAKRWFKKLAGAVARKNEEFYRVLIESVEPKQSFVQVFWCSAKHPGQAIDAVFRACARLGINNPIVSELDYLDLNTIPDDSFHEKKSNVWCAMERYTFPTEKTFIAPLGIVGTSEQGEHEYEQIREGFQLTKSDDIYEIEAVVERDNLLKTFFELAMRLPSIKVFWIRVAPDWEDRGWEQLWTNDKLNIIESISSFLASHFNDTVANGHVALTVYSDAGQTNLTIDTHKTIVVLTKSKKMQDRMAAGFRKMRFEELSKFYSLRYDYHHYHYRPTRSKSRRRLVAALKRSGFKLWQQHQVEPEEMDQL
jgi:hypothetical protein